MGDDLFCSTSNLQCAENTISCFDESNSSTTVDFGLSHSFSLKISRSRNLNLRFCLNGSDSSMGFSLECEETVRAMVEKESEHFPRDDYLERLRSGDLSVVVRKEALDWIWKAQAHYNFSALSVYLSMNYLDRFISSVHQLPMGQSWIAQLLAVACVSLAAKMEEIEVPLPVDLQIGEPKFVFEARTIQRMELLVLSTLKWRMLSVTPFSFIDYFLTKINTGRNPSEPSVSRAIRLTLNTINDIDFLEFRPSEIAAAVATSILVELEGIDVDKATSSFEHVDLGRVRKCIELITSQSTAAGGSGDGERGSAATASSVPRSPVGVLEAACWSSKSDESVGVSSHNCPNIDGIRPRLSEVDLKS